MKYIQQIFMIKNLYYLYPKRFLRSIKLKITKYFPQFEQENNGIVSTQNIIGNFFHYQNYGAIVRAFINLKVFSFAYVSIFFCSRKYFYINSQESGWEQLFPKATFPNLTHVLSDFCELKIKISRKVCRFCVGKNIDISGFVELFYYRTKRSSVL